MESYLDAPIAEAPVEAATAAHAPFAPAHARCPSYWARGERGNGLDPNPARRSPSPRDRELGACVDKTLNERPLA